MANEAPSSWRDVYALVRDTRTDVLGAVGEVDTKVTDLRVRVDAIEVARATESGRRAGRDAVFGVARTTIAIALSVGALLLSAFNALGRPNP